MGAVGPADDEDRPGEGQPEPDSTPDAEAGSSASSGPPAGDPVPADPPRTPDRTDRADPWEAVGEAAGWSRTEPLVVETAAGHNGAGNGPVNGSAQDPATADQPWTAPAWEPVAATTAVTVPAAPPPERTPPPAPVTPPAPPAGAHPAPPSPPDDPAPPPITARTPPRRTHRWGLGAYLFVEAVFLLASLAIGFLLGVGSATTAGGLVLSLAVPPLLAAGTALLITRLRGHGPRRDLRLMWSRGDLGSGVGFGLAGLVLTIPASMIYVAVVGDGTTSAVGEAVDGVQASVPVAILVFLLVVLIVPICEEIVYRGLLWGGVERLAGPRVAAAVCTLLFALAHFEFTRTPLLLVVALPMAAARYYTGRLPASIIAHQINNLLPGVILTLQLLGVSLM